MYTDSRGNQFFWDFPRWSYRSELKAVIHNMVVPKSGVPTRIEMDLTTILDLLAVKTVLEGQYQTVDMSNIHLATQLGRRVPFQITELTREKLFSGTRGVNIYRIYPGLGNEYIRGKIIEILMFEDGEWNTVDPSKYEIVYAFDGQATIIFNLEFKVENEYGGPGQGWPCPTCPPEDYYVLNIPCADIPVLVTIGGYVRTLNTDYTFNFVTGLLHFLKDVGQGEVRITYFSMAPLVGIDNLKVRHSEFDATTNAIVEISWLTTGLKSTPHFYYLYFDTLESSEKEGFTKIDQLLTTVVTRIGGTGSDVLGMISGTDEYLPNSYEADQGEKSVGPNILRVLDAEGTLSDFVDFGEVIPGENKELTVALHNIGFTEIADVKVIVTNEWNKGPCNYVEGARNQPNCNVNDVASDAVTGHWVSMSGSDTVSEIVGGEVTLTPPYINMKSPIGFGDSIETDGTDGLYNIRVKISPPADVARVGTRRFAIMTYYQ